mgnify:CR=1 FL=1
MKHISSSLIFSFFLFTSVASAYAVDPCEIKTKLSGGLNVTKSDQKDSLDNGFHYELWMNGSVGTGQMNVYGGEADCAFKASWNNGQDYVARCGFFWGKEIENTPSYKDLDGDIHAEFSFTKSGSANNYSFIGVYGWSKDPMVEFYISDDTYNSIGAPWQTEYLGSQVIDGANYNFYKGTMVNKPGVCGNVCTFTQIFSIRQTKRQCGHISVSEHFKAWEKLGIKTGALYDCKIVVESGGSVGSVDFHYATMWIGDENGPLEPQVREPFDGIISIPGVVEAENYDKGGINVAYYDTDRENKGGVYREDGVDISEIGTDSFAVGYTMKGEWLEYTVNVEADDNYYVEALMANGSSSPKIDLVVDGKDTCSLTGVGVKNDWDTYSVAKGRLSLEEGEHILRLNILSSYTNIDNIKFFDSSYLDTISTSVSPVFASTVKVVNGGNALILLTPECINSVKIISMTGQTILESRDKYINVEKLMSGVYLISVITSNGEVNTKINITR